MTGIKKKSGIYKRTVSGLINLSNAHKGQIPWNKDKKMPPSWNKGKKLSEGHKNKISIANKGKKKPPFTEETKRKMRENHKGMTGRKVSESTKKKMSDAHKGSKNYWYGKKNVFSKERIRKILKRRLKSSLEVKFEEIINKHNLPYKFVGNGKFFIERKNPDFININGEKKAIEVYYTKHKEKFRDMNIEQWKKSRSDIFSKYGWELIFFNEVEVNENNIIKTLKGGVLP